MISSIVKMELLLELIGKSRRSLGQQQRINVLHGVTSVLLADRDISGQVGRRETRHGVYASTRGARPILGRCA